jgi:hypothetical protein
LPANAIDAKALPASTAAAVINRCIFIRVFILLYWISLNMSKQPAYQSSFCRSAILSK